MLWIGIYIAAASLVCSLATAADVIRGVLQRKFWFPCKYFTLNAFSLTLLAVAMKFPLDINTSMPSEPDQLVKLSSSAFLCIVMGNFMPSLGAIHDRGILSNVTALGILVITLVVNICIELNTGVIYSSLRIEYILVSLFMIVLLVILCFSALAVPSTKKYIEWKYGEMDKIALSDQEVPEEEAGGRTRVEKLFGDVRKYWMMAETGNPQFLLARSVTCAAAGAICLLTALILAEAEIRLFFRVKKFRYSSNSDYKSSTLITLIIQSGGVVVGTIAPAFRWFIGTDYRCSHKGNINSFQREFKIENYWIQGLVEWKERPLALRIHSRKCRKLVQDTKNLTVSICMGVQIAILLASKTVRVISIFFLSPVLSCCYYCTMLKKKLIAQCTASNNHRGSETRPDTVLDLSRYVLLLEGEEELPTRILKRISDAMNRLIQMARKNHPKNLMELLEKSTSFKGVVNFDNDKVERLHSEEPPNCWSLPVVTLTSIAIALPNIKKGIADQLIRSVREGLLYISLTEKSLDVKRDLINIRTAADFLWLGVELYRRWLKNDLQKMALEGKTSMENLHSLNNIAKRTVLKFKKKMSGGPMENPLNWPVKVIAANSMYRISQTILLDYQCSNNQTTDENMFEQLSIMIADILGACLTNLPRVIKMKCFCSAIESREESVLLAARLLGETEEILKSVQKHELPDLDLNKVTYIDEWRSLIKEKYSEPFIHSYNKETSSYGSPELDESKFNEPMPWIGIYVAAASAACAMAMAMDTFHGLRYRKFWFPCKFFSLNATTLTLIAVAVKLSVDLNTAMPGSQDQLAKLSSAVFICTAMGNFMPSLGTMENKELMMNIVALGILVITVIVNICIQLGTGVIFVFWKEHALVMLLMLILLAILSSSALAVPSTKVYLEIKYSKKLKLAVKECSENTDVPVYKRMRENLPKYWMMAHTCNPQFVIGRLATCTASGAFCLLSAVILAEAMLRSYFVPRSFKFCHGDSDYKWSTTSILVTQIIAVGVGTIAPAFRWFTAIKFRCPKKAQKASKTEFKVEKYWNQKLVELKECPLALRICGRNGRKLVHNLKNQILDFCIGMQSGIVLVSKLVRFISIFLVGRFLACLRSCSRLKRLFKCNNSFSSNDSGSERQPSPEMDLSRFVVHLQGEEVLVDLMMENNSDPTLHWIRMGEKKKPKHLIQLLEKSNYSQELKGVSEFDSHLIPSLDSEEPPNCWALPVVTLTSIATALPNIDHHAVKQLIRSVHEGLVYVRVIENNLSDAKGDLINTRKAAEIVWLGVDLYHKWLDVDLHKMGLEGKCPKDILEGLSNVAKNKFVEFKKRDMHGCLSETPSRWPIHALAANSMYRICQTTLQGFESKTGENSEKLFERLSVMISDILSACLTNLKSVIANQCNCSTVEKREERVRYAILLFGETEEILKNLELFAIPDSYPDERAHIDDWRLLSKQKDPLDYYSSSAEDSSTASFSSPSFQISIE